MRIVKEINLWERLRKHAGTPILACFELPIDFRPLKIDISDDGKCLNMTYVADPELKSKHIFFEVCMTGDVALYEGQYIGSAYDPEGYHIHIFQTALEEWPDSRSKFLKAS